MLLLPKCSHTYADGVTFREMFSYLNVNSMTRNPIPGYDNAIRFHVHGIS